MNRSIDFDSPIPFYVQLLEILKSNIDQEVWRPGDQLPGEHALCEQYGVSRTVVRQTLAELEKEGLIYRHKGKGAFLTEPKISGGLAQKLTGFYQDMEERGHPPRSQVLRQETIPAPANIAQYLAIDPGADIVALERLRFVNDEPIVLVTSYFPQMLCPGLEQVDFTNQSLYNYCEEAYGYLIARGRRFIEAIAASEREASLLQIETGDPLILLNSVSYLDDGTPFEYYHAIHRGDRSRFEVELVRIREQGQVKETLGSTEQHLPPSN